MNISIISVFPQLYDSFLTTSLIKRAQENNLIQVSLDSFFSFVPPKQRIDAPGFGPGAGMLIKPEVVERAIQAHEEKMGPAYKIFFSPQGKKLDQDYLKSIANRAQQKGHIMLLPARYEGMDSRVEQEYADEIVSVGDFVLMGGDIAAIMLLEGMLRCIPFVVGKQESVTEDSFSGALVDYPQFTEPVTWHEKQVPEIVRSGNHAAIAQWRTRQAAQATLENHFTWFAGARPDTQQKELVASLMPSHYVVLAHCDVYIGEERKLGTTSVTSIDIHDIARSSRTYGVKQFFVVTPLIDQQNIVQTLLDFWQTGSGATYNRSRFDALKDVELKDSIAMAIKAIEQKEGKKPLVIATSARSVEGVKPITYFDQGLVWKENRPVLMVFGTGKGLSDEFLRSCDYVLVPVEGLTQFNHLSVRSAVAIILDRWLGLHPKKVNVGI